MTVEERFDRIERYTAGLIEERRKDREEYKMLWRDTNAAIQRLSDETRVGMEELREADQMLGKRIDELVGGMHELRQGLDDLRGRVDSLVSAIGASIRDRNARS